MNTLIHGPQWVGCWQVVFNWARYKAFEHAARLARSWQAVESGLLAATLIALVGLGMAGAFAQLAGADELVRHLTLVLGMLGSVVAARHGRLLSIGFSQQFLPDKARNLSEAFSGIVAASVCALLTLASWRFVATEAQSSSLLAFGIPRIALQSVLPLGFAVLTVRIAWRSSRRPILRVACLVVAASLTAAYAIGEADLAPLRGYMLAVLGIAVLLGAPIFVGLAGVALVFFMAAGEPISTVPLDHYEQVTNPLLATLPTFHAGRLHRRCNRRFAQAGPRAAYLGRSPARRSGGGDHTILRILHGIHRRLRCDDPGSRRIADADPRQVPLPRAPRSAL